MTTGYKRYNYDNYDEYIHMQMQHTKTMERTAGRPFSRYIEQIKEHFPDCKKVLCVGSRDVSEVHALRSAGYDAIGIDLFSTDINVIRLLDMHNISDEFSENEFDLIYACHVLEHSYDPEKVLRGFRRVSKTGAFIVLPFLGAPHAKDPIQFNFMAKHVEDFDVQPDVISPLIEEDFRTLGCACTVKDLKFDPLGNNHDGYWMSIHWKTD